MASAVVPGAVSPPDLREVELSIRGMTCAACAARVEKKLGALRDVAASVNFATEKATVTAPFSVSVDALIEAVEQAGYGAELARPHPAEGLPAADGAGPDADRVAYLRRRLIVALVFFVPLSDLSVQLSLFPAFRFPGWQWVLRRAGRAGSRVGGVAVPRRGAEERPAWLGVDGHAGVAGHRRGVRLVGVRDVLPRRRAGQGQCVAAADPRIRRRDLPGGRGLGDHLPAGGPMV